jgi:hypothetical protein
MLDELKTLLSGAGSPLEWLLSGAKPVRPTLANRRAATCVACPFNSDSPLTDWFTDPAAAMIQKAIEASHDLKLETPYDPLLGTCKACLCVTRVKVHEPLDIILKHMKPEVKKKLAVGCWITLEDPNTTNEHDTIPTTPYAA